jgi:hypothetical protein
VGEWVAFGAGDEGEVDEVMHRGLWIMEEGVAMLLVGMTCGILGWRCGKAWGRAKLSTGEPTGEERQLSTGFGGCFT